MINKKLVLACGVAVSAMVFSVNVYAAFISADNLQTFNSTEKGGINLYRFVNNDPVNNWDYLGLFDYNEKCAVTIVIGHNDKLLEAYNDSKKFPKETSSVAGIGCTGNPDDRDINVTLKEDRKYPVIPDIPSLPSKVSRIEEPKGTGVAMDKINSDIQKFRSQDKEGDAFGKPSNVSEEAWKNMKGYEQYRAVMRDLSVKAIADARNKCKNTDCCKVKVRTKLVNGSAGGFKNIKTFLDDASLPYNMKNGGLSFDVKDSNTAELEINCSTVK